MQILLLKVSERIKVIPVKYIIILLAFIAIIIPFSSCVHRVEYISHKNQTATYIPTNLYDADIALVLGGGGSKGYAHLGVLEVLEKNRIPISIIVGTSAGSIIGALYADEPHIELIKKKCNKIKDKEFLDAHLSSAIYGPVRGIYLQSFLRENLKHLNIENFSIPFAAVATSLETNKSFVFTSGSAIPAIHASSALPMIFTPVYAYNQHFIDGGAVEPVPVNTARAFRPKLIIAVDVSSQPSPTKNYDKLSILDGYNAFSIAYHALSLSYYELAKVQVQQADIAIKPNVYEFNFLDGAGKEKMYQRGKEAAEAALNEILIKMYKLGISKTSKNA